MACARIYEGFLYSSKRSKLEAFIDRAGHKFPPRWTRGPASASDHLVALLIAMDRRGDPRGDLSDLSDDDLEIEAGWTGKRGLFAQALVECGWIDVSEDGKSRRWHDYGAFNSRAISARRNGEGGGRPRDPGSVRSKRGDYDPPDETQDETQTKPSTEPNTKPSTKQSGVRSPESDSERSRPEDGAPACPRPPPPGSPSAASRTTALPTPPPGMENHTDADAGSLTDDGSDMAEPAPREAKPIETAAQTARRLAKVEFERDLTRKLRLALPSIVSRWNETIDELDKEFPLEQYPKRASWIRYDSFPKSTKIRSALRARAREALEAGRKFSDDFENALLGVRSMEFWTTFSKGWRPNLESFFVASKWETKIAAGKQLKVDAEREAEKERIETEAFDKEFDRIHTERLSKLNRQVSS